MNNVSKTVEVNRNILGKLAVISSKSGKAINFSIGLEYPLCTVPLSLANADGSIRKTTKSKLLSKLVENVEVDINYRRGNLPIKSSVSAYIVDLMAGIRQLNSIPETYHDLTMRYLETIPVGYQRVDIVADSYKESSIKSLERNKRGISNPIKIRSPKSKIPKPFSIILNNGKNKSRMIELMCEVIVENKSECLAMLGCKELYFSGENVCKRVTAESVTVKSELCSNQEEADTKLILHCQHALNKSPDNIVIVRSPSGDIDIIVLMIGLFINNTEQIYIDSGREQYRRGFKLCDLNIDNNMKLSLIGFHSFTGNDYVSSFYKKERWYVGKC